MTQSSVQSGAKTKTVTGPVEAANRGGVKIAGAWHNYGRTFKGERPDKDAVGRRVELTLVYSTRDGKWFIRSVSTPVETKAHAPAKGGASKPPSSSPEPHEAEEAGLLRQDGDGNPPDESAPSGEEGRLATPEALKYSEDLALKEGWTSEELNSLVSRRFGKSFQELSPGEASKLIVFFGGYQLTGSRGASQGS
jgi:hypothetical protein